jgi:hypothetical protein
MFTGQLLIYRFNGLHNAKEGVDRNIYRIEDVAVNTKEEFKEKVHDALDEVPPGRGYVLIKWDDKVFIAEKDPNKPEIGYIRHEIIYHPLLSKFTI